MPIFRVSAMAPALNARVTAAARKTFLKFCMHVAPLAVAGHELFAARRKRVFEHLLWRSLLFYKALMKEHHFAGDLTGEAHFVGHEQHGAAFFGQCADDTKYFLN